ncbi:MAG: M23 family metallopeptidase [Dehalococcoidia bacterium]|nr:M23 family metallopeptidase [Dehalococcoidia bacterium]
MGPLRFPIAAVLLCALTLVATTACSGGGAQAPTPTTTATPTPKPKPTPMPTPEPTPTPIPPSIALPVAYPKQGGFLLVQLLHPPAGTKEAAALFNGGSYPMVPNGDAWTGVIGMATDFPLGGYTVEVIVDGVSMGAVPVTVAAGGYPRLTLTVPDESIDLLSDAAKIAAERQTVRETYATFTPQRLWSGPWLQPARGPISNGFGVQRSVNGAAFDTHGGTDIAADGGDPVAAAASGRVALAQPLYLLGNSVIIDHGAGLLTGYHHLSSIAVTAGQEVTKGDIVGKVGATGFVSGDHLHWEARIHGVRVDPMLLLKGPLE